MKFFLNTETKAYLRGLSKEFGESTNAVRVELNRFSEAGLLEVEEVGRKKLYTANKKHQLFHDLHSIVKKFIGIDQVIEQVVAKLGNVELAYIQGDYAKGIDSGVIELVIIGKVDHTYLEKLQIKAEQLIDRKLSIKAETIIHIEDLANQREEILVVWNNSKD